LILEIPLRAANQVLVVQDYYPAHQSKGGYLCRVQLGLPVHWLDIQPEGLYPYDGVRRTSLQGSPHYYLPGRHRHIEHADYDMRIPVILAECVEAADLPEKDVGPLRHAHLSPARK
jgi:hypothetical protein